MKDLEWITLIAHTNMGFYSLDLKNTTIHMGCGRAGAIAWMEGTLGNP